MKLFMKIAERILNMIFPPRCVFCDSMMESGADLNICSDCYGKLSFSAENPVRMAGGNGSCDAALCVCKYTGIMKDALIRYKFYKRPGYYRTFAKLLVDTIYKVTNVEKFDMIISVPLHKRKEFTRGYNQALLISKALGRETGINECSELLARTRHTEAQSLLDKKSRNENVKGAFEVTDAYKVKGKYILLVDDIMTTGNTLNECSKALKDAGAKAVLAAVLASGQAI